MTARKATATGGTNTRRARGARRARRPARTSAATKRTRTPWSRRPHLPYLFLLLLFPRLLFLTLVNHFPLLASCLAMLRVEEPSVQCAPSLKPPPSRRRPLSTRMNKAEDGGAEGHCGPSSQINSSPFQVTARRSSRFCHSVFCFFFAILPF